MYVWEKVFEKEYKFQEILEDFERRDAVNLKIYKKLKVIFK